MKEKEKADLKIIEKAKPVEKEVITAKKHVLHTNPIARKFLEFQKSKEHKFSVLDLFRS